MATSNVVTTRTGTNWTVDVTACNLDANLTIKDFSVLHAGVNVPNADYTKTTRTVLTYTGTALPASTSVEIRRKTPSSVIQPVTYASRFNSSLWNSELERKTRWQEEADLNGVGALSSGSLPAPKDDAYGSGWDSDVVYPPTRNSVYDKIETLAPKAAPTFTGVVTVPNYGAVAAGTTNTTVLSHGDARVSLDLKANLASPVLSGTPYIASATAATPVATSISQSVATTQFVYEYQNTQRPVLYAQTGSRSIAPNALQGQGNIWYAGRQGGGLTTGTNSSNRNYCRVDTNGWYKVGVRVSELSGSNDYWFITANILRHNGSGFIGVKAVFKYYLSAGTRLVNPILFAETIVPIVWETNADKIISIEFQHNNDANATRNWEFDLTIERISL